MLYPLLFEPIFQERVWGGRALQELYGKPLPPGPPIGESWELSDRPGAVNRIANGPLAGNDLHWLLEHHRAELLGAPDRAASPDRFPLLIKILDARERLSLQVHPPAHLAAELGGEPKTEMWFIAHAEPGAELYAGLKRGVSRSEFENRIRTGTVAECFHRLPVKPGDAMFLPSGRVHAIGAGLVIFEIQQNSDTTYRVFDWNRVGLDGRPRQLHVRESLASIDFEDYEPGLVQAQPTLHPWGEVRVLADNPCFTVEKVTLNGKPGNILHPGRMQILGVVAGRLSLYGRERLQLGPGAFCLVPAQASATTADGPAGTTFLRIACGIA